MKRTVIKIDEELCNGCGNCIAGCHEGALQLICGKAVMISELYCDGLGACIGECPMGAISFEEREAAPYDEAAVMERLLPKGDVVVLAHLKHLKEHGETEWLRQGVEYLKSHDDRTVDLSKIGLGTGDTSTWTFSQAMETECRSEPKPLACGCPGTMAREIKRSDESFVPVNPVSARPSELRQFPVQLHLLNPQAGFLHGADLLLAADCTAFACGDFHSRFLRGKSLAIACPKLDSSTDIYIEKLVAMIDAAEINTLTVAVMEVPCCRGLVRIAQLAREQAQRNIPIKVAVLSVSGNVIDDRWI